MGSLKERLDQDMKEAMKAREAGRLRLSVIRMAKAAIKNAEIARGTALGDDDVADVLRKEIKQRHEALEGFERAGRAERVAELWEEIAVLEGYLPAGLSAAELEALARQAVAETGATGPKDMGRVMSALMPRVKGRADGGAVNAAVRRLLEGR